MCGKTKDFIQEGNKTTGEALPAIEALPLGNSLWEEHVINEPSAIAERYSDALVNTDRSEHENVIL